MQSRKMSDQIELARVKCDLAKERSKNQSLTQEIEDMQKSLNNEIRLLQETIEAQANIISELHSRSSLADLTISVAESELEISESESDLSMEVWDFCEKSKPNHVENESFKMVFELSQEVDELKENLAENSAQLETYREEILELENSLSEEITARNQLSCENRTLRETADRLWQIKIKQDEKIQMLEDEKIRSQNLSRKLDRCKTNLRRTNDYLSNCQVLASVLAAKFEAQLAKNP